MGSGGSFSPLFGVIFCIYPFLNGIKNRGYRGNQFVGSCKFDSVPTHLTFIKGVGEDSVYCTSPKCVSTAGNMTLFV